MHKTKNDLSPEIRKGCIELLNSRLADCIDLLHQGKQAHWNVKGPNFIALHKLFDEVVSAVTEYMDIIAERIAQLGGTAEGTIQMAAKSTSLPPYPSKISSGQEHVEALSSALAAFGKNVRQNIDQADKLGDKNTADILTEVSRGIDQYLWFVEAHQQADR